MSENPVDSVSDALTGRDPVKSANLIYILYLVGIIIPVVPIVAVVLAYMYRKQATGWLESHNTYQIRTFWIGLLYGVIAMVLMLLLIGWLVYVAILIWLVVRCVKGMQALARREPIPDPQTWMV
ncbi:putative membrane protein [Tepidamorphus gemmatus]|uniref:Putative membrane protein n=1 Tax=Tepidamorphus gemmatus TaxID=747076 RepID=A0A4R3M3C9_9HYPH|nr:hypothetical protein [Tepidamorphus gemmatus]TCT07266.1 putative membrane protein [Tepidamorphus gemmatus]